MTDKSDLDQKTSSAEAEQDDVKGKSVDYEAKYRGLSRKFTKLQEAHEKLQELYDDAQTSVEEAKSQARSGNKELEKEARQLKADLETAQASTKQWEQKVKAFEAKETTRKILSEKFPQLMDLNDAGDLKSSDQFEKPEDYEAYLSRLAAKIVPATTQKQAAEANDSEESTDENAQQEWLRQRQQYLGATPPVSLASRDGSKTRSRQEVEDELFKLNPNAKDYDQKYLQLEDEMNRAMASERQGRF